MTLKRIAVIAFSFGIGAALISILAVGGFRWYNSRPRPPKPWNTTQLKTQFSHFATATGDEEGIIFYYDIHNTAEVDYLLDQKSNFELFANIRDTLTHPVVQGSPLVSLEHMPLFIPAGQRVRVLLKLRYPHQIKEEPKLPKRERRREEDVKIRKLLKADLAQLDGFALFDKDHRYQIIFAKKW